MRTHFRLAFVAATLAVATLTVSADGQLLPSSPKKAFGASISQIGRAHV